MDEAVAKSKARPAVGGQDFRDLAPLEMDDAAWKEAVPLGPADLRHGTLANGLT